MNLNKLVVEQGRLSLSILVRFTALFPINTEFWGNSITIECVQVHIMCACITPSTACGEKLRVRFLGLEVAWVSGGSRSGIESAWGGMRLKGGVG